MNVFVQVWLFEILNDAKITIRAFCVHFECAEQLCPVLRVTPTAHTQGYKKEKDGVSWLLP